MARRAAPDPAYRTSSFSGGGNCVQAAQLATGEIAVKHSADDDPAIVCSAPEWQAFVAGVKNGEFDF